MAGLSPGAHVVQFYADAAVLVDVMARFVGTAVVTGDAAVVLATEPHESALRKRLQSRGVDVQVALGQGRYIPIEAADLARRVVRDGHLEEAVFRAALDEVVARGLAACDSDAPRVMIFGETVDLLVRQGLMEAALDAERIGNELIAGQPVSICCGYGIDSFRGESPAAPFLHVCGLHTQVFPAERRRPATRFTRATAGDHH